MLITSQPAKRYYQGIFKVSRYYQADALQIVKKDAKRAFPTKQIGDIDFYKSEQNFV